MKDGSGGEHWSAMSWRWHTSAGSDFNHDFEVTIGPGVPLLEHLGVPS
jgi:hypothetical protein